jgi:hypothetical protein
LKYPENHGKSKEIWSRNWYRRYSMPSKMRYSPGYRFDHTMKGEYYKRIVQVQGRCFNPDGTKADAPSGCLPTCPRCPINVSCRKMVGGFTSASTNTIQARLRLAVRQYVRYYGDKEDLLEHLI